MTNTGKPADNGSNFQKLAAITVNDKIEKKGNLSYLSWPWAVDQLLRMDPDATWTYLEPRMFGETMMVYCTVTAFGKAMTEHLPVMNHRNQAIESPNAFEVNTAMQRCLVKAIALHGLGLYIYAGEDLPSGETGTVQSAPTHKSPTTEQMQDALDSLPVETRETLRRTALDITALIEEGRNDDAWTLVEDSLLEAKEQDKKNDTDTELMMRMGLWSLLDSKVRSAIKRVSASKKTN